MKWYLLFIPLLTLSSCNKSSSSSTTTAASSSTAPYLWSQADFPKELSLSVDFDAQESTNIHDMSSAWDNAFSPAKTFFNFNATTPEISSTITSLDELRDNIMGVYKTTTWPSTLPESALAITQIFGLRHNTGSASEYVDILHADILVNYDNHSFQTGDTGASYDLQTVILHEMGHFLGLKHRTDISSSSTIMYPSISTGFAAAKRAPRSADVTAMTSLYETTPHSLALMPISAGEEVRIIVELHADGRCIHKESGRPDIIH